jgi:hypothetical protein
VKRALVLPVLALAVVSELGSAAPAAVEARSCRQLASTFNVQIVGDRDAVHYFGSADSRPTQIPDGKTAIVVWSFGGPARAGGLAVQGWITSTRSGLAARCSTLRRPRAPSAGKLGDPVGVRDGWFTGRKFSCLRRGRLVIETRDVAGGKRLRVWMQQSGEVIALGEVRGRSGWLRGSPDCRQSER